VTAPLRQRGPSDDPAPGSSADPVPEPSAGTSFGPAAAPPPVRELRRRLRAGRRRHHPEALTELLGDLYMLLLGAVIYGAMFLSGAPAQWRALTGTGDPAARSWLALAALLAGTGLLWQALRAVGPLLAGPATLSWVLSAPVDRRAWLRPRFAGLVAAAAALAAVLAVCVTVAGGRTDGTELVVTGITGAVYGVALAGLGVVAQTQPRRRWPRLSAPILMGAGAVVALVVVGADLARVPISPIALPLTAVLLGLGLPAAVAAVVIGLRRLHRLDRIALSSGAGLANALLVSAMSLDPGQLVALVESRRNRRTGKIRGRRLRPAGRWWLLLQADLVRLTRRPGALLAFAALLLAQYALALALPSLAGPAQVVGAYLAGGRFTAGLSQISRTPALRRMLGGPDWLLRLVHLVLPAAAAGLFWLLTVPVGAALSAEWTPAVLIGMVVAVYRSGSRPPMNYGGAYAVTPMGMIPVDLLRQIFRGWDVLIGVALLVLLLG